MPQTITLTVEVRDTARVITSVEEALESAHATLRRFQDRMNNIDKHGNPGNPGYAFAAPSEAFAWSGDAFKAAAEVEILTKVLDAFRREDNPWTVQGLISEALREVVRGAASPESSTSPVSNLMAQSRTSVWAGILREVAHLDLVPFTMG